MIVHIHRVIQKRREQKQDFLPPILNLIPFLVIFFCSFYYVLYSTIGFKTYPITTVSHAFFIILFFLFSFIVVCLGNFLLLNVC